MSSTFKRAGPLNYWDNDEKPFSRKWYAVQDLLFDRFMEQVPICRTRLREIVAQEDGPQLDLSVASLEPLSVWATDWAKREPDDGEDWLPVHYRPDFPRYQDHDVIRKGVPLKYRTRYEGPLAARM